MYMIRIQHTAKDGFQFFISGATFRRKRDAESYKRLYYRNSARIVQVVRVS
jgi:hypothetical protein